MNLLPSGCLGQHRSETRQNNLVEKEKSCIKSMHLVFVRLPFFVDCLQTQSEYPEISFNFDTLVFIAVLDGNKSSSSTEFKSLTSDFQGNE